jgi:hypothetical protein
LKGREEKEKEPRKLSKKAKEILLENRKTDRQKSDVSSMNNRPKYSSLKGYFAVRATTILF